MDFDRMLPWFTFVGVVILVVVAFVQLVMPGIAQLQSPLGTVALIKRKYFKFKSFILRQLNWFLISS